jgi:hypothetical protein
MGESQVITAGAALSTAGAGHRNRALRLAPTTDVKALMASNGGRYDTALAPLWNGECAQEADPFGKDEIAFYQCDHLGHAAGVDGLRGQGRMVGAVQGVGASEGGDQ